jgi:hypothetical protein
MKKMIKYPSTPQFREIVGDINRHNNFVGLDEAGNAIYDPSKSKPVIKFIGTVKLHGTSSGVCFNNIGGLWVQSRSNIITPQSDNAGFAFFVESKKESFIKLIKDISVKYNVDLNLNTIVIYSEWAGAGIQKGVGITNIDKSCFIYGVKISPIIDTEEKLKENPAYWVDYSGFSDNDNKIYNMLDFKTFEIDIDFNRPELSQNSIINMTLEVENECPVAKFFGFPNTIGEGIVYTYINESGVRIFFKSKGELHAGVSKVKTLKNVDDVKIQKCIDLAEKITPSWRLEQMLNETFDVINGGQIDVKQMGLYLKAIMNDIVKEELLTISDTGLGVKDISKYVSEIGRNFFFQRLNENVGLK